MTSENVINSTDPDFSDGKEERDYVIAEEVTRLQFEYWDGTQWQDTWDGRTLNADGITPTWSALGYPRPLHLWMNVPGPDRGDDSGERISPHDRGPRGSRTSGAG